jgi:hypothetical protein
MGRYYSGDIEGKFWFGVQSSKDPSFFGGQELEPNTIEYYFDTEHLDSIKIGINKCKNHLIGYEEKIKDYFDGRMYYNDKEMAKALKVKEDKLRTLLEWYARLELGKKILDCVEKNGYCQFDAEL